MKRRSVAAISAVALLASACYLPRVDVERDVSTFVLAHVTQCSAETVAGEVAGEEVDRPIVCTAEALLVEALE